jgi:hypothetical protein
MKKTLTIAILTAFTLGSCAIANPPSDSKPISHQIWDGILKTHVTDEGMVDYAAIQKDSNTLNSYLKLVKSNHPNDENWSKNQQLAYWINAYNAFTVQLIIRHYPLNSIKDIGSSIKIPFVNTPWDVKFIHIEDETYDLNNLEHGIIRKQFEEPRIHFALVCAAVSCPRLKNEAYTAEKLNAQLDQEARNFINNKAKNNITKEKAELSKLFMWYKGDFTKKMSLIDFINQYSTVKMDDNIKIEHKDYLWDLNKQ